MQVHARYTDRTLVVCPTGTWTLRSPIPSLHDAVAEADVSGPVDVMAFDTDDLEGWDSSLVTFLFEAAEFCREQDVELRTETLPSSLARLVSLSQAVPEQETDEEVDTEGLLGRLGLWALDVYDEVVNMLTFVGRAVRSIIGLFTTQVRMRWRTFGVALQSSTSSALPIVTVISLLVGLIIAFLGAVVLRRFGADYYVSYLVSYGMLRELGALMTAIIMTGRTGAAFAAEIGSMKIAEEIDALKTLGISPIDFLVTPRILAIVIAMPMLTVYADMLGILGGMAVATTMLDLTYTQFLTGLLEPVVLSDGIIGVVKSVVYGSIIGVAGCMRGMQTGNDASAVGQATTSAVVTGIILIVLANAIIDWAAAVLQV
ncbi:ABC transporter permease [Salinibacter sp. 10B]|uniref:MlaE family ABC transporter permease n=1 Tax=Salinibacter sp. 10B TaxID=1923971 RepID=UPI000CF3CDA4|nr:ABC transporter permease [Salinibacter sp. 10B]PQJ34084.1 ABC transporter permease [Salinibacter sp. 10B]